MHTRQIATPLFLANKRLEYTNDSDATLIHCRPIIIHVSYRYQNHDTYAEKEIIWLRKWNENKVLSPLPA